MEGLTILPNTHSAENGRTFVFQLNGDCDKHHKRGKQNKPAKGRNDIEGSFYKRVKEPLFFIRLWLTAGAVLRVFDCAVGFLNHAKPRSWVLGKRKFPYHHCSMSNVLCQENYTNFLVLTPYLQIKPTQNKLKIPLKNQPLPSSHTPFFSLNTYLPPSYAFILYFFDNKFLNALP